MFSVIRNWFGRVRTPRLNEQVSVSYDATEVRVLAAPGADSRWNQSFRWSNVRRVCFKDGGMLASDVIYISLKNPDTVMAIPTEARGGPEFFGALSERGLFPEAVWRKAVGDTSGGMHCWPPPESDG
jgi:hypothetical protein